MRFSQVSTMAMMLALAACGGGGNGNDGGGSPSLGGSLPTGSGAVDSGGGQTVALSSPSSVTVGGVAFGNPTVSAGGVKTFKNSQTAAAVDGDTVLVSRVGQPTLGATLSQSAYGAYAVDQDGAETAETTEVGGFYAGRSSLAADVPTAGTASYTGGAMAFETATTAGTTGGAATMTVNQYTGTMTADANFAAGTVDAEIALDDFGTLTGEADITGNSFAATALTPENGTGTGATDIEARYGAATGALAGKFMGREAATNAKEVAGRFSLAGGTEAGTTGGGATSFDLAGGFGASQGTGGPTAVGKAKSGTPVATTTAGTAATVSFTGSNVRVALAGTSGGAAAYDRVYSEPEVTDDGLLKYTTNSAPAAVGEDTVWASRVGEDTLDQTLDYAAYGVWAIDPDGVGSGTRQIGAFHTGAGVGDMSTVTTGTANYTGTAVALERTTATGAVGDLLTGTMTATADLSADTVGAVITLDDGPTLTYTGAAIDNATATFGAGATVAVTGDTDYASATGAIGGGFFGTPIPSGANDAKPEEIAGNFSAAGSAKQLQGSFGGKLVTTP
ncbi:MAG: transferrin-binding protein-like solute binding protein [Geminicoccaceae bacterium]|nr:transferrin-binding protein-like solute binding protein [Geminicoccaceae bacterium]